jgi:hypothetical protein
MLPAPYLKMLGLNILDFPIVISIKILAQERVKVWEKKPNS